MRKEAFSVCSVGSCNASTSFIPHQMSYFITLTSIAPTVFVADVELQLLFVREKRAQSVQLKMYIYIYIYIYIYGKWEIACNAFRSKWAIVR